MTRAAALLRSFRRKLRTVPRCPYVAPNGLQCAHPKNHYGAAGLFGDIELGHFLDFANPGHTDSRRWHNRVPRPS